MNNEHIILRMNQRGLAYDLNRLQNIALECSEDTAVILGKMVSDESPLYKVLVILIVRNRRAITIMTRRESQNFTKANFNVQKIIRL